MTWKGEIAARGRFCDRDEGTEGNDRQSVTGDFLDESLWVDPCADGIWTKPDLPDGRFNLIDRGYRDVLLKRASSIAGQAQNEVPVARNEIAIAAALGARGRVDSQTKSSKIIKQKAVRKALWAKHLKKYLRLRLGKNDDVFAISLRELRVNFLSYAMRERLRHIPTARSSIEEQIKKALPEVVAEYQAQRERDQDATVPSMDQIANMTDPSRWPKR